MFTRWKGSRVALMAATAICALCLLTGTAGAVFMFPQGEDIVHLTDRSTLVNVGSTAPILENRSLFKLDTVLAGMFSSDSFGVPKIIDSGGGTTPTGGVLSGMLYDAVVSSQVGDTFFFVPGARYTNTTTNAWTDTVFTSLASKATTAGGYGGLLVLFEDSANVPTYDGVIGPGGTGPAMWVPGGYASADPSLPVGDFFPTFSDVPLPYLVAVLAPLPAPYNGAPAGSVMTVSLDGKGYAFANIIGGYGAGQFFQNTFGTGLDIRLEFQSEPAAVPVDGGWPVTSFDPVQFAIVPEPLSMIFFGTGLVGVLGFVARRRMQRS